MELEFENFGKRLFGTNFSTGATRAAAAREQREREIQKELFPEPVQQKTIRDVPHHYQIVDSADQRRQLVKNLLQQQSFCFDTETTSLDPRHALPLGIAFC